MFSQQYTFSYLNISTPSITLPVREEIVVEYVARTIHRWKGNKKLNADNANIKINVDYFH